MNRRNFFKNLTAAVAGVIVAPVVIVKALKDEPKILCGKGLFRWVEDELKKRETVVYATGKFNLEDFEELRGLLKRDYTTNIIKESIGFDGNVTVYKNWGKPHPDNLKYL